MSDTTALGVIRDAMLAAIRAISPQPFSTVDEYAGPVTQSALAVASKGGHPSALLGIESDLPVPGSETETLTQGIVAQDSKATWRVLVVVETPADESGASTTDDGKGYLALATAVRKALNGLAIDILEGDGLVHFASTRTARIDTGVLYAIALQFTTVYAADVIEPQLEGVPFERFDGDIDLVGEVDDPENPLAQLRVDF
jgi:hypothetical protein